MKEVTILDLTELLQLTTKLETLQDQIAETIDDTKFKLDEIACNALPSAPLQDLGLAVIGLKSANIVFNKALSTFNAVSLKGADDD